MKPTTRLALIWITDILIKHNIAYQISGGLAVQAYGSTRELADIDIEISEEDFIKIKDDVASYIIFGPGNYKSERWDLYLMTLNYNGQEIDISGAHQTKIYDMIDHCWVSLTVDLAKANNIEIDRLIIPVIPRSELIAYKEILSRYVDLIDLDYLKNTKLL